MSFEDTIFPEVVDIWDLERLYKDLAQVKHIGTEKVTPLTPVEKAILRGLLAGNPPKQIAAQLHWTPGSMSVELSNGLYRYVETLTNRDIKTLKNWRDVAKWLEEAKYKKSKIIQDWEETPDISHFYGREAELAQLKQAILVEKNRLILLLGMGGIGKTVLAAKLAQTIHNNFEYTIWRNLRYAPPLAELLTDLLTSFNPQIEIPASINSKISRLIEYLRQNKCLLILDGLEGILCHDNLAGFYQEKYRNYSQLIKRIAEESHQSCLILTSQDEPADLLLIQTQKFTSLQLGGLGEAARQILQEKELSDTKYWRELVERYHGNPLAIKLVAATIKDLFGGSVDSFLSQGTEFGVIIPVFFKQLLSQQFRNLSELEKQIMCILALNRRALSVNDFQALFPQKLYLSNLTEALNSLKRRSLIEITSEPNTSFTLQPMVMKYVIREHAPECEAIKAIIKSKED